MTSNNNNKNTHTYSDDEIIFHKLMIDFITSNSRLFKMEWLSIWSEFYRENMLDCSFNFQRMEPVEIRKIFLRKVLPNIYTYNLTEDQKEYIELLNNDKDFLRVENGFRKNAIPQYYRKIFNLTDDDFTWYTKMENISPNQTVFLVNLNQFSKLKKILERSLTIQQTLSIFYSNEEETKNKIMLSKDEIFNRIIEHKNHKNVPNNIRHLDEVLMDIKEEEDFLKLLCKWVEGNN